MNFKKKPKAFTLIEVLVSVGIFLMTIIVISQIFITVIRSERVAYALLNSENNVRNNVELMAKTIRMGKDFEMSSGGEELCFKYYLDNDWQRLCYKFDGSSLKRSLEKLDNGDYKPLLDPQIKLNSSHFYQIGNGSDSQLSFIIQLEAQIKERNIPYLFHVETAVTSRYLGQ
jgi:hypothetical protein